MEMLFCPACGTRLRLRENPPEAPAPYCESCGEFRFPVFSTAISAVVLDPSGEKTLLIRQYGEKEPVFVAGYVDKGETAEEAVVREVREELGMTVLSLAFQRSRYYAPSETLMLHYAVTVAEAEASPNWEVDSWEWVETEEAGGRLRPGGLAELLFRDYLEVSREKRKEKTMGQFYGKENATPEILALYEDLKHAWCRETCAPRMQKDWSEENPTLGQCSITSFLVQDLLGGKVFGVPLPDGAYHCFNVAKGVTFDLTSEQFGEERLCYDDRPEQFREVHFADPGKRERYELLKRRLLAWREEKG